VPAPVAICVAICVVFAAARTGRADDQARRQVAVIDLSADDTVRALADSLYRALNRSDVLRNPDRRGFESSLTGPLVDEDKVHVDSARDHRVAARAQLFTSFDAKAAEKEAGAGEVELQAVTPTAETRALYAELSLVHGLALLDRRDAVGAACAFALTHRLDPTTQLDPAQYPPDITAAFQHAIEAAPVMAPLAVSGTGRLWIDGRERGDAPGTFDVEVGDHVVVLTGSDRETTGAAVRVQGTHDAVDLPDVPASDPRRVERARLALSRAQAKGDDAARAGAMKELAALLGVGDAVMISKRADGKLQWETWKDRAPGFSAPKLYTNQQPEDLLEGLAPPAVPKPVEDTPKGPTVPFVRAQPLEGEQSWYQRRWVQASAATGLAAAIIGAILWARRDENVTLDHDVKGM